MKPLFIWLVIIVLFIILPVFYLKKYIVTPKNLFILLLVLTPLLFQITLMKVKYDTYSISKIGSKTFRNYFLSQYATPFC